jgi:LPS export ABC transporter protein LptC
LLFFLSGCRQEEPQRAQDDVLWDNALGEIPEQVIENMEVIFTEAGRRTGILQADSVAIFQEGNIKKGKRITIEFFGSEGEHISTLTALEGIYDTKNEEIRARGDVVILSDDGARLETEVLSWKKETNRIFTDAFVTISRGKDRVSGYGLSTDPQLEDLHIQRDVKGRIEDIRQVTE